MNNSSLRGEDHPAAVMTAHDAALIRGLRERGVPFLEVIEKWADTGITIEAIRGVYYDRTWLHIGAAR